MASLPGMPTESSCMAIMMVLRDSRTSLAEAKRAEGCFSRQWRMTDSSSTGRLGLIWRMEGGSANWVARMVWNSCASGRWKGVASGGELVEDEAEGEDVGLDGGLAGDELLWRHVGDGAAASGVGGAGYSVGIGVPLFGWAGGIEVCFIGGEAAGEAEVEDLDEAAVGEHDVGWFEVAMEDAERVGGGETVRDLNAGGEDELEAGGTFGDELVEGFCRDVLHDDVGFALAGLFGLSDGLADLVDGAYVGMVDGGGEAGFAELGGAHLLNGEIAALEEFEDDGTLEEGVGGEIDDSAAARADLADELVLLDLTSLHEFIIASDWVWMI